MHAGMYPASTKRKAQMWGKELFMPQGAPVWRNNNTCAGLVRDACVLAAGHVETRRNRDVILSCV